MRIELGMRVRVKREQNRICGPLYPGRDGVVVADNFCGSDMDDGYWYVLLRATRRAKERIELFPGTHLEAIDQAGHPYSAQFLEMAYRQHYRVKEYDQVTLVALLDELVAIEKEDGFAVIPTIRRAVDLELARRGSEPAPVSPGTEHPAVSVAMDVLRGYGRADAVALVTLATYDDWQKIARQELERRATRIVQVLDEATLEVIAAGGLDFTVLCREVATELSQAVAPPTA
ncbi:MAG: hypothetical protein PHD37_06450 [Gallionellaceae bacterium]|nr:hypothetical protein [Gallionellaceae bacterium]